MAGCRNPNYLKPNGVELTGTATPVNMPETDSCAAWQFPVQWLVIIFEVIMETFTIYFKAIAINWILLLIVIEIDKYIVKDFVENNETLHIVFGAWATLSILSVIIMFIWWIIKL